MRATAVAAIQICVSYICMHLHALCFINTHNISNICLHPSYTLTHIQHQAIVWRLQAPLWQASKLTRLSSLVLVVTIIGRACAHAHACAHSYAHLASISPVHIQHQAIIVWRLQAPPPSVVWQASKLTRLSSLVTIAACRQLSNAGRCRLTL